MELYLIRHGEPDTSLEDLSDPPLTELGHRQAAATAQILAPVSFDAVYVSPQRRAQQTCEPLVAGRPVSSTTEVRIAEFDYEHGSYFTRDSFPGLDRAGMLQKLKELQGPEFQSRVLAGMNDIIANHAGHKVAVVCHGGVINVMFRHVVGAEGMVAPRHASVTRIEAARSGQRSLTTFNEHHWILSLERADSDSTQTGW